ncbi:MAG TPA: hypothetical protein VNG90_02675, partial [Candidatus Acidoferrum sp.]|nr:hypothetical protein [Candidatus Acidoferrum sp.]
MLQLALVVQFLVLPESDFRTLALLALLIAVAIILLARKIYIPPREKTIWIDRKDIIALCVAAIFVVPFGWYCFGPSGLLHITTMAGIQVPDATNHFISLSDMSKVQHLSHQLGYYPKGFDMSSALIQNSFGLNQTVLPWATNAYLFMFQYVAWNGILAYFLGYFAYLLLEKFDGREQAPPSGFLLVLSIGIPLTILYLLPFIFEGFLNFSYVCATIAGSYIYLAAIGETNSQPLRRWYILGYLLMIFGVSFSWPLLTPPLLLTPLLYFWPQRFRFTDVKLSLINRRNLPVIIGFAMQLIPLYMDFRYSTPGS